MGIHRPLKVAVWCLILSGPVLAEEPGQSLPNLIRGNERFASKLLLQAHSARPDRNIVISPLSLTLIFAALQTGVASPADQEIGDTFGWGPAPTLRLSSKMLLAAFEKPLPLPPLRPEDIRPLRHIRRTRPEAAWINTNLLYRGHDTFSDSFVADAQKYFGITFRSTGDVRPIVADFQGPDKPLDTLPKLSKPSDVLINSTLHLQTAWQGNTFSMGRVYQAAFTTGTGEIKQVETLKSESGQYPYAKTDRFEAISLPCNRAYFLAILPAAGRSVQDLERDLASAPYMVDLALKEQLGSVAMPTFHFQFEAKLEKVVQQLGIRTVFGDLRPLVKRPEGAKLTEVAQKIDIQVSRDGIRANAETVVAGIYGGITNGPPKPFVMELNRPFVFLIRDQITNALLFSGAIEDPTQK